MIHSKRFLFCCHKAREKLIAIYSNNPTKKKKKLLTAVAFLNELTRAIKLPPVISSNTIKRFHSKGLEIGKRKESKLQITKFSTCVYSTRQQSSKREGGGKVQVALKEEEEKNSRRDPSEKVYNTALMHKTSSKYNGDYLCHVPRQMSNANSWY